MLLDYRASTGFLRVNREFLVILSGTLAIRLLWTCIPFWNPCMFFSGMFFCGSLCPRAEESQEASQFVSKATTWERLRLLLCLSKTSVEFLMWRVQVLAAEIGLEVCIGYHFLSECSACSVSLTSFSWLPGRREVALRLRWSHSNQLLHLFPMIDCLDKVDSAGLYLRRM